MSRMTYPLAGIRKITPSDTAFTDADGNVITSRSILIGTDGAIKITDAVGKTQIIPSGVLATGIWHPMQLQKVWNEGTTATNIYCGFDVR